MDQSESVQPDNVAPAPGWEGALRAYQRGQPERAREALAPLMAEAQVDDEVLYLAGLVEARCESWDEAERLLADAAARSPERIGRWLTLAEVRRTLGRAREAVTALHEALVREPRHVPALNDLGLSYHQLGLYREALRAHDEALAVAPDFADALRERPRLLARLRQVEAAHTAYRDALKRLPHDLVLRLDFAEFLERGHQTEAAEAQLEWAGHPDDPELRARAESLRARLCARRGRPHTALQRLAATRRATGADWLAYQEGGLLHEARRPAAAMRAFGRANAARAREWRFRRLWRQELTGALEQKIEAGLAPTMGAPADPRGAPAFLLGLPRSGTTLLDRMVAAHPCIQVIEEPVSLWLVEDVLERGGSREQARAAYWEHIDGLKADGRPVVVDKNPLHAVHLDVLARVFPDAPVIVLMRHPYDAALSCYMQDFDPNPASLCFLDLERTGTVCRQMLTLIRQYEQAFPERAVRVHYERLVADYRDEVARVLEAIGCDWDEGIEHFATRTGFVTTPSYAQVARGLYDDSIGRWRDYEPWLDPVRRALAPMLPDLGYGESLSLPQRRDRGSRGTR